MIVNPWTVSSLSLDGLSAALGLVTAALCARQVYASRAENPESGEAIQRIENRLYLLFWLGTVFLLLRILAWPLFYLSLHSLIPEISGAMCIFGARNLQPTLSRVLELIKPLLFYTGLVWLLLFKLERYGNRAGAEPIARKSSLLLLCFCTAVGLVDSFASLVLWLRSNAELAVSCCTTVTDIPSRFTVWIPEALLGPEYGNLLWALYFFSNVLLIVAALFVRSRLTAVRSPGSLLFALLVITCGNAVVGIFAFIEVIAPFLMGLPFHHCFYCLVQNVADGPIFVALFILGNSMIAALYPVYLFSAKWAEYSERMSLLARLLFLAVVCLSGSVLMITTHLFH